MRIVLGQVLAFPYIFRGPVVIIFLAKDTDFKVGFRVAISPTGISQFPSFTPHSALAGPSSQLPGLCVQGLDRLTYHSLAQVQPFGVGRIELGIAV